MLIDPSFQDLGIGHEQIVTHQLDVITQLLGQHGPPGPVRFVQPVLN